MIAQVNIQLGSSNHTAKGHIWLYSIVPTIVQVKKIVSTASNSKGANLMGAKQALWKILEKDGIKKCWTPGGCYCTSTRRYSISLKGFYKYKYTANVTLILNPKPFASLTWLQLTDKQEIHRLAIHIFEEEIIQLHSSIQSRSAI